MSCSQKREKPKCHRTRGPAELRTRADRGVQRPHRQKGRQNERTRSGPPEDHCRVPQTLRGTRRPCLSVKILRDSTQAELARAAHRWSPARRFRVDAHRRAYETRGWRAAQGLCVTRPPLPHWQSIDDTINRVNRHASPTLQGTVVYQFAGLGAERHCMGGLPASRG